ncbi:MAG: transglycosylase domain-containing protein [Candidatus Dormibacteraceae bacterium]
MSGRWATSVEAYSAAAWEMRTALPWQSHFTRAGHIVSDASTITKQEFLTPAQTYSRKLQELALAYELCQAYTKDQIMELYLNKSFYGSQSYGIEAAAEDYFHIHASQLDLAQAAVLAGLPSAPTEWNPALHPDASRARKFVTTIDWPFPP